MESLCVIQLKRHTSKNLLIKVSSNCSCAANATSDVELLHEIANALGSRAGRRIAKEGGGTLTHYVLLNLLLSNNP